MPKICATTRGMVKPPRVGGGVLREKEARAELKEGGRKSNRDSHMETQSTTDVRPTSGDIPWEWELNATAIDRY